MKVEVPRKDGRLGGQTIPVGGGQSLYFALIPNPEPDSPDPPAPSDTHHQSPLPPRGPLALLTAARSRAGHVAPAHRGPVAASSPLLPRPVASPLSCFSEFGAPGPESPGLLQIAPPAQRRRPGSRGGARDPGSVRAESAASRGCGVGSPAGTRLRPLLPAGAEGPRGVSDPRGVPALHGPRGSARHPDCDPSPSGGGPRRRPAAGGHARPWRRRHAGSSRRPGPRAAGRPPCGPRHQLRLGAPCAPRRPVRVCAPAVSGVGHPHSFLFCFCRLAP